MSREPIRKLPADSQGRVRYRAVVDTGRDPATGRRKQATRTFPTLRAARAWVAETRTDVSRGTHVDSHVLTVAEYVTAWLEGRRDLKPATRENYLLALRPVTATVGARPLQALTKSDLDSTVAQMLNGSLRSTGTAGKPLSARSVRLTLGVLSQALDSAVREGRLHRNVAALVERPRQATVKPTVWEASDTARFLSAADNDRLAGAWRLTLHGLRRGEVLALRWQDVDLEAGLVAVHRTRVVVAGQAVIQDSTKTTSGRRTVPLSPEAVAVLRLHRAQQREERLLAGSSWADQEGHLVVDTLGRMVSPRWYADTFKALSKRAGVPVVRLHDARHAYGSYLLDAGVPVPVVAQVMGHASPAITMTVYAHALRTGADERVRAASSAAGL